MSDSDNKADKRPTDNRWWENYFLRYAVGTVVGAGAIIWFCNKSPLAERKNIFEVPGILSTTSYPQLLVLIVLGLAYCYIASAPILALHGLRAEIRQTVLRRKYSSRAMFDAIAFLVLTAVIAILWIKTMPDTAAIGGLVFGMLLAAQLVLLFRAISGRLRAVTDFATELADNRAWQREAPYQSEFVAEYVQSYRHMREHGNAFSIIILEVILAAILTAASDEVQIIAIVVFWVAPAASAWFIATGIEFRLESARKKWENEH